MPESMSYDQFVASRMTEDWSGEFSDSTLDKAIRAGEVLKAQVCAEQLARDVPELAERVCEFIDSVNGYDDERRKLSRLLDDVRSAPFEEAVPLPARQRDGTRQTLIEIVDRYQIHDDALRRFLNKNDWNSAVGRIQALCNSDTVSPKEIRQMKFLIRQIKSYQANFPA